MKLLLLSVILAAFAFAQEPQAIIPPNAEQPPATTVQATPPVETAPEIVSVPGGFYTADFLHPKQTDNAEYKFIQGLAKKWEIRFGMTDWKVNVYVVSPEFITALTGQPALAASHWDPTTKSGEMYIMAADEYSKATMRKVGIHSVKRDQENSVVHEILHNVVENSTNEEGEVAMLANMIVPE